MYLNTLQNLVVDDPDEEEAVLLNRGHGQVFDVVVGQGIVSDGDTTSWIGRGKNPGRVHRDDVEQSTTMLHLCIP